MRDYKNRLKQLQEEREEPSTWEVVGGALIAVTTAALIISISYMVGA